MTADVYVLGVGITHNSTACLLKNGKILAAASEERFVRKKNINCYPANAIDFVLRFGNIGIEDVSLIAHGFQYSASGGEEGDSFARGLYAKGSRLFESLPSLGKFLSDAYVNAAKGRWKSQLMSTLRERLKVEENMILPADHHTCHAYAAYYGVARNERGSDSETLAFTADAEGDGLCASISIAQGDRFERVNSTRRGNSLAAIYAATTEILGMKANEHEYKVMGLAPYAASSEMAKCYPIFDDLIRIDDDLHFKSKLTYSATHSLLRRRLAGSRFDGVAAAVQKLAEDRITDWITRSVSRYPTRRISVGGGFFMNVKANMAIMNLGCVDQLFVCPSAGDESVAIGAAYYGYRIFCERKGTKFATLPLETLYLGPEFSDEEIASEIENGAFRDKVQRQYYGDINAVVADLLANNKVVARFNGRMEWGARSLGNRSILANPSNGELIRTINEQIKGRDFWMPFAPTILSESETEFIVNPKEIPAPFMVLAFDTTPSARKNLKAAIHPYDFTARPQVLKREHNPEYYDLIRKFESITGIGAVLNTSFNLHGDPVVCSPTDAFETLVSSELEYLAIGHYLVSKKP